MTKTIKKLNLFGIVFLAIFALSTLPAIAKDDADDTPKEITSLNELLLKVQEEGFKIIAFKKDDEGNLTHESNMPPHVERFLHMYEYLRKAEPYDWVVTTDVKDVSPSL